MQAPTWTEFLQCSVCTNRYDLAAVVPVSLTCGHTICKKCLPKLKARACPYDKTPISPLAQVLPPNTALLSLLGHRPEDSDLAVPESVLPSADVEHYVAARQAVEDLAQFLQPLVDQENSQTSPSNTSGAAADAVAVPSLTKPMQKKLAALVNCQLLEAEGRSKALRAARSIADRTVTELLVLHQNQQQVSTLLWTAIRNRGCQFLGPVLQEDTLRFILKVMETGQFLSRKTIVLYVLQQLQNDYPQASKTSVGHVVQLLYRASCFNVEKRDEDSSLMQLKEEYRTYPSLRREHDIQIVKIAMEAGLRISPEQWSLLLRGNHDHKSEMQSIIDKLVTQGVASCGLNELIVSIGRAQDPYNLSERIIPPLEVLLKIEMGNDQSSNTSTSWSEFVEAMRALVSTLQCFSECMQRQSGRYKTGMCSNILKLGECLRGSKCTYAHSEEEKELYRSLNTKSKNKPRSGEMAQPSKSPAFNATSGMGSASGDLNNASSPYLSGPLQHGGPGVMGPSIYDYTTLPAVSSLDHPAVTERASSYNLATDTNHLYGSPHQGPAPYVPRGASALVYNNRSQEELHRQVVGVGYVSQYGHTHQNNQGYDFPASAVSGGRDEQFVCQTTSTSQLERGYHQQRKSECGSSARVIASDGGTYTLPGAIHEGDGVYLSTGSDTYGYTEPLHYEDCTAQVSCTYPRVPPGGWVVGEGTGGESSLSDSSLEMTGPQYFSSGGSPYSSGPIYSDVPSSHSNKSDCSDQTSASASPRVTPITTPTLNPTYLNTTTSMSSTQPSSEPSSVVRQGSVPDSSRRPSSNASHGSSSSSATQGPPGEALPTNIEELQERVRALELKLREKELSGRDHAHPTDTHYPIAKDYHRPLPPLPPPAAASPLSSYSAPYPGPAEVTYPLQRVRSAHFSPLYPAAGSPGEGASQYPGYGMQPSTFHTQPQPHWREVHYPGIGRGSSAPPTGFHHHASPQSSFLMQSPTTPVVPSVHEPFQEQFDQMLAAYLQHVEQQKAMSAQRATYGRHGGQPPFQPTYTNERTYFSYPRRP